MSEKPSEYLKRTCLICGCHTNQTINIYEPRSGPNIVQLIQAKFKFQPLNEDKYLCFSCNNWLINWHSLQAMNSNDTESPSGTFRSSLNNVMSEKGSGASKQDIFSLNRQQSKPIAKIRPQQLQTANYSVPMTPTAAVILEDGDSHHQRKRLHYSKRNFLSCQRLKMKSHYKFKRCMKICCMCGRSIVILLSGKTISRKKTTTTTSTTATATLAADVKCRKCREIIQWRSKYLKSIMRERKQQKISSESELLNTAVYQSHRYQRPLVDGKIVSMLRRLGTTLSREKIDVDDQSGTISSLPQIMSPAKKKQQWRRQMDEDEILIDFESAITEVLPQIQQQQQQQQQKQQQHSNTHSRRRKLIYDGVTSVKEVKEQQTHETPQLNSNHSHTDWLEIDKILPKGLTVSLVSC